MGLGRFQLYANYDKILTINFNLSYFRIWFEVLAQNHFFWESLLSKS
jgi:hypothetical protein